MDSFGLLPKTLGGPHDLWNLPTKNILTWRCLASVMCKKVFFTFFIGHLTVAVVFTEHIFFSISKYFILANLLSSAVDPKKKTHLSSKFLHLHLVSSIWLHLPAFPVVPNIVINTVCSHPVAHLRWGIFKEEAEDWPTFFGNGLKMLLFSL